MYYRTVPTRTRGRGGGCSGRLLIAAAIAAFSLFSYFSSRQDNPVTGETQYIDITPEQEIALGLEAAPQMAAEHGFCRVYWLLLVWRDCGTGPMARAATRNPPGRDLAGSQCCCMGCRLLGKPGCIIPLYRPTH